MSAWIQVFTGLGAATIGGLVAPQISQAQDRRAARATVRERLVDVEALRWIDEPYPDFRRAIAALESSAMIARVPRGTLQRYVKSAEEARAATKVYDGVGPNEEPAAVLMNNTIAAAVEDNLAALSTTLWHPWASRWYRHRTGKLARWYRRRRAGKPVRGGVNNTNAAPDTPKASIE